MFRAVGSRVLLNSVERLVEFRKGSICLQGLLKFASGLANLSCLEALVKL